MATLLPFYGVRPLDSLVEIISCPPYDVVSSSEARSLVKDPRSFLRVTRPEVDDPDLDEHDPVVYDLASKNYKDFKAKGYLAQDNKKSFYIYEQTLGSHSQTGIVGVASCAEYESGIIKQHEHTRADKEQDRVRHIASVGANTEPVFFAYKKNQHLKEITDTIKKSSPPLYSFTDSAGTTHKLWRCDKEELVEKISNLFKTEVSNFYIADGHHRSAASCRVYASKKSLPGYTGQEEFNYFMSVCFPEDELQILSYNRLVKDLAGLSLDDFLNLVSQKFKITKVNSSYTPKTYKTYCMYVSGTMYLLEALDGTFDPKDPVASLDASILQDNLLGPILKIQDPRTDSRIDFAGGIKPVSYLISLVDSGKYQVAFIMYPVSMSQIIDTADSGKTMPPKSTWFEPKLKSGLFIHEF